MQPVPPSGGWVAPARCTSRCSGCTHLVPCHLWGGAGAPGTHVRPPAHNAHVVPKVCAHRWGAARRYIIACRGAHAGRGRRPGSGVGPFRTRHSTPFLPEAWPLPHNPSLTEGQVGHNECHPHGVGGLARAGRRRHRGTGGRGRGRRRRRRRGSGRFHRLHLGNRRHAQAAAAGSAAQACRRVRGSGASAAAGRPAGGGGGKVVVPGWPSRAPPDRPRPSPVVLRGAARARVAARAGWEDRASMAGSNGWSGASIERLVGDGVSVSGGMRANAGFGLPWSVLCGHEHAAGSPAPCISRYLHRKESA